MKEIDGRNLPGKQLRRRKQKRNGIETLEFKRRLIASPNGIIFGPMKNNLQLID